MNDLIVAIGLVFVIEGLLWALFPSYVVRMLQAAYEMGEGALRVMGLVGVALGCVIVWFIRG